MKVAFLTHYTNLYGANRSLLNLIEGLKKYNVYPYVIAPSYGEITDTLQASGVPFEVLPIQAWLSEKPVYTTNLLKYINRHIFVRRKAFKRLSLNLNVLKPLVTKLKEQGIDIVHTNSSIIPVGVLAAKQLGIPHVWHWREFGDLDYGLYPDWGMVIHHHIMNLSDTFVAISESIKNHLLPKITKKTIHVIYNGIASEAEFDRFYALSQSNSDNQQSYTFAIVGLVRPSKGQATAIRALSLVIKKFPEVRLLVVGDGNIKPLQQLANSLGIEKNIEFWGHIQEPYKAYLAANAVLMCSKNEGMGRVTVEAMSICRPVIGYDNAGTSELIEHEKTGLLYENDHQALANCMLRLVENPAWGRQLGHNAWEVARKRFSVESYAQAMYEVFLSVTQNR